MTEIRLDERVAVVTGAGGGLGRAHALLMAARGAKVVVNDLGGDRAGKSEGSGSMADAVVTEIQAAGGTAIANHDSVDSVEGATRIVDAAIDAWGRIDVVVNNAGILRDASFAKMAPEDHDAVLAVHLAGTVNVTRAAWPHLRAAGYGRVINTTSGAGLFGNFGQTNYSAAKLGIVGFTRTLALEGATKGITANIIAPLAASRLTEDIMTKELFERFKPEYVAGMVTYLASEACELNGQIFEVGGGYYSRAAIVEGYGIVVDEVLTPEQVQERIAEISTIDKAVEPHDANDLLSGVFARMGVS